MRLPWVGGRRVGRFRLRDAQALSGWGIEALEILGLFLGECTPGVQNLEHHHAREAVDAARLHFKELAALAGGRSHPSELAIAQLIAQGMVDLRRAVDAVDRQMALAPAAAAPGQLNTAKARVVRAMLAQYRVRLDGQLPADAENVVEASRERPGSAQLRRIAPNRPVTHLVDARYPRPAWFRAGRLVVRYLWLIVAVGFTVLGAHLAAHAPLGSGDISDLQDLIQSLLLDRTLLLSTTGLLLMAGVVVLVALLAVASSRARADRRREHAVLKRRAHMAAQATLSHAHTAAAPAAAPASASASAAAPERAPAVPASAAASTGATPPTDAAAATPSVPLTPAASAPSAALSAPVRDASARTTPRLERATSAIASGAEYPRAPVSSRPSAAVADPPGPAYAVSVPAEPTAASAVSSADEPSPTAGGNAQRAASFVPRVFVSHSGDDDKEWGARLVGALRAELGGDPDTVWYDSRGVVVPEQGRVGGMHGGDYWQDQIAREIRDRNVFVALLTPDALRSQWVQDEIRLAWDKKNSTPRANDAQSPAYAIVPVLLRPCKVPPPLNLIQYISFLPGKNYDDALAELVAAIHGGATRMLPLETEYGPPFDLSQVPQPDQFVGRQEDLAWLLRRLRLGGATAITALRGIGGIGKTALAAVAVHLAYGEGMFPDGIGVVLCQNRDDWAGVLRDVLTRFHPNRKQPEATDAAGLADAARALLRGKRALVVLDNIEPDLDVTRVVAPLREQGVTVLLTARHTLPRDAVPVEANRVLDVLPPDEALELFAQSYGRASADALSPAERAPAIRIVADLACHTLAVKLAGAYAADAGRDLAALERELADPAHAIALPQGEVPDGVARVFASSYRGLPPEARRLFAALAAFATPEFGRRAALALATALALPTPEPTLNVLVLRALADPFVADALPEDADRERLRLHPLLRAYAASELARATEYERHAAFLAVAGYYAEYANAAPDLALAPDEANITGALEWAHTHGEDELVARLCSGMDQFWPGTGRIVASLRYLPWGVAAAEALLGAQPDMRDDDPDAAEALAAWRQHADRLFWLLYGDGYALQTAGKLDEAVRRYERCLTVAQIAQSRRNQGAALNVLGQVAQRRRRLEEAEGYFQESLTIAREVQDRQGEGADLSQLGQVARLREHLEEAEGYFQQSLSIRREVQDRQGEGVVLGQLGQVAQARGRLEEAERYFQQSLAILREVQDRQGEGAVLYQLAIIAEARGNLDRAEALHRESLAVGVEVQSGPDVADSLLELGRFLIEYRDKREEGCQMLRQAIALYAEMGLPGEQDARETARRLGCLDADETGA